MQEIKENSACCVKLCREHSADLRCIGCNIKGGMDMAHIERRMYRRRRRQARRRLAAVLLLMVAAVIAVLILTRRPGFLAQRITLTSPTPVTSAFDRTVATREVTLPAETWYAIQTGVFSTQEAAREKAGAYAERGAPGTVVQEGDKWRVFIACYGSEADAASVRQRLGEHQRVETYLYRWTGGWLCTDSPDGGAPPGHSDPYGCW